MKKLSKKLKISKFTADTIRCITIIVISVSVLFLSLNFFVGEQRVYYFINVSTVFSAIMLIFVNKNEYGFAVKIATLTFVLSIICTITYHFLSKYQVIEYLESVENVIKLIKSTGAWGIFAFFSITLLQVVILPIPTAVTVIVGSVVYGPLISFLLSSVATFLGSVICFFMGRVFGKKLINWLFDQEKAKKYAKLLGKRGKIPFIVMMLLPFFPDDLICVTAGCTDMKLSFFLVSVFITRSLYILLVSFLGDGKMIPFTGWGAFVWAGIFLAISVGGILLNAKLNKFNKDNFN